MQLPIHHHFSHFLPFVVIFGQFIQFVLGRNRQCPLFCVLVSYDFSLVDLLQSSDGLLSLPPLGLKAFLQFIPCTVSSFIGTFHFRPQMAYQSVLVSGKGDPINILCVLVTAGYDHTIRYDSLLVSCRIYNNMGR